MSTPSSARRRQPERGAKSQAARKHMSTKKPKNGMLSATPNSYYLAIAQRNAEESRLLRLPPEIRNKIWSYVVQAKIVYVGGWEWFEDRDNYPKNSILQVCRQSHAETCLLAYTVCSFWFWEPSDFKPWFERRLPGQIAAVQRMQTWCCECADIPIRSLPNLKSIDVTCVCGDMCWVEPEPRKVIEETLVSLWGNSDLNITILRG